MSRSTRILTLLAMVTMLSQPVTAAVDASWIHIEVRESGAETSRVNVNLPLSVVKLVAEMAPEKIFKEGRLQLDGIDDHLNMEEIQTLWQELRQAGESEFVTVEDRNANVRVRVEGDHLLIDVEEHARAGSDESATDSAESVKVKVPVSVVDALFQNNDGSLDFPAAIERLAEQPGEIVRVEDDDATVRIWVDER